MNPTNPANLCKMLRFKMRREYVAEAPRRWLQIAGGGPRVLILPQRRYHHAMLAANALQPPQRMTRRSSTSIAPGAAGRALHSGENAPGVGSDRCRTNPGPWEPLRCSGCMKTSKAAQRHAKSRDEVQPQARSVTLVPLALDHIARSESDLDSTLALSKAEGTVLVPHAADGLPRRYRYRGACLRRIVTFSQTFAHLGLDLVQRRPAPAAVQRHHDP